MLKLYLLGTMDAQWQGRSLEFRSNKIRGLLAYLAMHAGRPHRREVLASLFWSGATESTGRNNLRSALSRLRSSLKPVEEAQNAGALLQTTRHTVQLNLEPGRHRADALEFGLLLEQCEAYSQGEWWRRASCIRWLEQAMELYHGDFLAGMSLTATEHGFDQWLTGKREQLHSLALWGLDALGRHTLALGDHGRAQRYARQSLELEPWNEAAHQRLIRSLLELGKRPAAQEQYEACRRALQEQLGLEPSPATEALLNRATPRPEPMARPRPVDHRPMVRTPFIGRRNELALLLPLLLDPDYPLVSVVGLGGIGKTRLALHAASQVERHFDGGSCFISLASNGEGPLSESEAGQLLRLNIAHGLQLPVQPFHDVEELLVGYLQDKELLLVLDNFESVWEAAPALVSLLHQAPELTCLVTSRQPLALQTEVVLPLEGLELPALLSTKALPAHWQQSESIQLFEERARRSHLPFELEEEAAEVVEICRLLEGYPLGIELAAAWVSRYSCKEIAQSLAESQALLASSMRDIPERHRSIRVVWEHTWQRLSAHERMWLAQCALFRGDFSLKAAQSILGIKENASDGVASDGVADGGDVLSRLVERSLLHALDDGRYALHALLREWGQEKLQCAETWAETPQEAQWLAQAGGRFVEHYLGQLRPLSVILSVEGRALSRDLPNLREAWRLALESSQLEALFESAVGLSLWYRSVGRNRESSVDMQAACDRLCQLDEGQDPDLWLRCRARILALSAESYRMESRHEKARLAAEQAHDLAASTEPYAEISSGISLAVLKSHGSEVEEALALSQRWLAAAEEEGFPLLQVQALMSICYMRLTSGSWEALEEEAERGLELARQQGFTYYEALAVDKLAIAAFQRQKPQKAKHFFRQATTLSGELGNEYTQAVHRMHLALFESFLGEYQEPLGRFQESRDYFQRYGFRRMEQLTRINQGFVEVVLGDDDAASESLSPLQSAPHDDDDLRPYLFSRIHMSTVCERRGRPEEALGLLEQALRWAQQIKHKQGHTQAHGALGQLHQRLGALQQAQSHFEAMLQLLRQGPPNPQVAVPLVAGAWIAWRQQRLDDAHSQIEEALVHLGPLAIYNLHDPLALYLDAVEVLLGLADPRAQKLLDEAGGLLEQRAQGLPSGLPRQRYLQLPSHQKLRALRGGAALSTAALGSPAPTPVPS